MKKEKAKVFIVGAGPGAPDLITLRGLRAIRRARVILYDALIDKNLLEEAPDARHIYVGKRCAKKSMSQEDINLLIVQSALRYGTVVRLKGGDPFVFGRGYEELDFIRSFDISVEVIPGLTSATSLATLSGVPLTHRDFSQSFWVITGTTKEHKIATDLRHAIKTSATLVVLMGIRKIEMITRLIIEEGRGHLPMMVIQNGSLDNEYIASGSVHSFAQNAHEVKEEAPGIIVIGETVALHPSLVYQKAIRLWNK